MARISKPLSLETADIDLKKAGSDQYHVLSNIARKMIEQTNSLTFLTANNSIVVPRGAATEYGTTSEIAEQLEFVFDGGLSEKLNTLASSLEKDNLPKTRHLRDLLVAGVAQDLLNQNKVLSTYVSHYAPPKEIAAHEGLGQWDKKTSCSFTAAQENIENLEKQLLAFIPSSSQT